MGLWDLIFFGASSRPTSSGKFASENLVLSASATALLFKLSRKMTEGEFIVPRWQELAGTSPTCSPVFGGFTLGWYGEWLMNGLDWLSVKVRFRRLSDVLCSGEF